MSFEDAKSSVSITHGTSVAGIIAATGGNEKGGRGIAYNASITSINAVVAGQNKTDEKIPVPLSYILKARDFNIVSNSMGSDFLPEDNPATYELFDELYEQNIAFIHAMGNEFAETGGDDDEPAKKYYMMNRLKNTI